MYTMMVTRLAKIVALASASVFLGLVYNASRKQPLSLWNSIDPISGTIEDSLKPDSQTEAASLPDGSAGFPPAGYSKVQIRDIEALQESGDAILVDAREARQYLGGHIPGAITLPAAFFRKGRPETLDYLPETERYVVYCSDSQHCTAADLVARQLILYGFKNVSVFAGGFTEWKAAGFAVESGL